MAAKQTVEEVQTMMDEIFKDHFQKANKGFHKGRADLVARVSKKDAGFGWSVVDEMIQSAAAEELFRLTNAIEAKIENGTYTPMEAVDNAIDYLTEQAMDFRAPRSTSAGSEAMESVAHELKMRFLRETKQIKSWSEHALKAAKSGE